ncbi:hypothetical protein FB45DRAFT_1032887 [Roridomyces roridus]|uniref:Uncharacterized protein n=1 Tax=Roridomyces roridus TaxID=1738132 RepID=A0AAD7FF01_9AGAR|nr:hypothetical protein FB45DRAFT_1032887 [Roridomyces roridus]
MVAIAIPAERFSWLQLDSRSGYRLAFSWNPGKQPAGHASWMPSADSKRERGEVDRLQYVMPDEEWNDESLRSYNPFR